MNRAPFLALVALAAIAPMLAACPGQTPRLDPTIAPMKVDVQVNRSCVPANLPMKPAAIYPATVDDLQAQLRATTPGIVGLPIRYALAVKWASGAIARLAQVEPVITECRDKSPAP